MWLLVFWDLVVIVFDSNFGIFFEYCFILFFISFVLFDVFFWVYKGIVVFCFFWFLVWCNYLIFFCIILLRFFYMFRFFIFVKWKLIVDSFENVVVMGFLFWVFECIEVLGGKLFDGGVRLMGKLYGVYWFIVFEVMVDDNIFVDFKFNWYVF